MHTDSCQLCSCSPGHTAAARYTHPHLTDVKEKEIGLRVCQFIHRDSLCFVQVNVIACLPVWHWWPVQPSGQAHRLGLKQVPPFTQGCAHTAVRDEWMIRHLNEYAYVLCWQELEEKINVTLMSLCWMWSYSREMVSLAWHSIETVGRRKKLARLSKICPPAPQSI